MLVLACSPKGGTRDLANSSEPAVEGELPSEPDSQDSEQGAEPAPKEDAIAAADEPVPVVAVKKAEPTTPAKKRYRRGGGNVRKGTRAIELKNAVNGAGTRVTLESKKAPVLVLTFGASWCAPCKKELPALEKLARRYSPSSVAFIAVNIDNTIATGKAFMKRAGLKRVLAVYDPKNINVRSYAPPTMPSVFIIGNGIVKHVHAGYRSGDERKLKKAIDRLVQ